MKWEYRVLTFDEMITDEPLNELGDQGWELVGLTTHEVEPPTDDGEEDEDERDILVCVFKREKRSRAGN